jgi:hypothetical protein
LLDGSRALSLRCLVKGKEFVRSRGELIGADAALDEDVFRKRHRRQGIRPAAVEREVRDDLRDLAGLDAVVER